MILQSKSRGCGERRPDPGIAGSHCAASGRGGPFLAWALIKLLACSLPAPAEPVSPAFDGAVLSTIERTVEDAIEAGHLPGAVLRLEREGHMHEEAYGHRSVTPLSEEMTVDTIFDCASLTKVVATTPCVMKLLEDGAISLEDPARKYLPELGGDANKGQITIRHLLTHTSGLNAGIRKEGSWNGYESGVLLACGEHSVGTAGASYRYSDVNFILLGEIARRVSGRPLDELATSIVFAPLGMRDTCFRPPEEWRSRLAPTTRMEDGTVLRGTAHDPRARAMGGVAGHAGLFSTAADLGRYSRMILNGGKLGEARILDEETVRLMTSVQSPPMVPVRRGLGWDIDSPYAGPRGTRFPFGSFGHTGWTGTSLWIDPFSRTTVIFLSNRNHPGGGNVVPLRRRIGTLAAEAIDFDFSAVDGTPPPEKDRRRAPPANGNKAQVLNGIDVLAAQDFAPLRGLRVGLVTNHTGVARDGTPTIDLLHASDQCRLVALFSPEHGIRGTRDGNVADGVDKKTGLPVHSLYAGTTKRKPGPEQLAGLDVLVLDLQDIGTRFYTYISTLGLCMEAAEEAGLPMVVLDRVNPVGGSVVEGPVRVGRGTFTAFHDIPVRHGMTIGEMARLYRVDRFPEIDLTVVPLDGWQRDTFFDESGLPWVDPSPNIRNPTAALIYPGLGLLEFTNLSVGRGTRIPFEIVGAPFIDADLLAGELRAARLPGVAVVPVRFTPEESKHAGADCGGVRILVTDRRDFRPTDFGLALARILRRHYPAAWDRTNLNLLMRHPPTAVAVEEEFPAADLRAAWELRGREFLSRRQTVLLYQ